MGANAAETLKGTRFCLLQHPARLKPGDKPRLEQLRRQNRTLDRAYELKQYLATSLERVPPDEAPDVLDEWLASAARSRSAPFVKLRRTVRKHAAGILAHLDTKMTNGVVAGINNKRRLITRSAYGFQSRGALMAMLFLCGRDIDLAPHLPTGIRVDSGKMRAAHRWATLVVILTALCFAAPVVAQTNEVLVEHLTVRSVGQPLVWQSPQAASVVTAGTLTDPSAYWVVTEISVQMETANQSRMDLRVCKVIHHRRLTGVTIRGHLTIDNATCRTGTPFYSGEKLVTVLEDGGFRAAPGEKYAVVVRKLGTPGTLPNVSIRSGSGAATSTKGWSAENLFWESLVHNPAGADPDAQFGSHVRESGKYLAVSLKGREVTPGLPIGLDLGPILIHPTPEHWNLDRDEYRPSVYGLGDKIRFEYILDVNVTVDEAAEIPITVGGRRRRAKVDLDPEPPRDYQGVYPLKTQVFFEYIVAGLDSGAITVPANALASAVSHIHQVSPLRNPPTAASLSHAASTVGDVSVLASRRGPAPDGLGYHSFGSQAGYGFNDEIVFGLRMSGPVAMGSATPRLRVKLGNADVWADYSPENSSHERGKPSYLAFAYTVGAEDSAPDGVELLSAADGGVVDRTEGLVADFNWPPSLAARGMDGERSSHRVDGRTRPPDPAPPVTGLSSTISNASGIIPNGADVSWNGPSVSDLPTGIHIAGYEYRFGQSPSLTGPWTLLALATPCDSTTVGQCPDGEVALRNLAPNAKYWFEVRPQGVHTATGGIFPGVVRTVSMVPQAQMEPDPVRFLRHEYSTDNTEILDVTVQWYPPVSPGAGTIERYEWELSTVSPATAVASGETDSTSIQLWGAIELADHPVRTRYAVKVRVCAEEPGATGSGLCTAPVTGSTALRSSYEAIDFVSRPADDQGPEARQSVIKGTELTISFIEQLLPGVLDPSLFTVTRNSVELTVESASAESNRVTLIVDLGVDGAVGHAFRLDYTHEVCPDSPPSTTCYAPASGITDLTGNPAGELAGNVKQVVNATGHSPTNRSTDTEPPHPLNAGGATDSRVVVEFSEDLNSRDLPPATAFIVIAGAEELVIRSVQICGPRLQLNLVRDLEGQSVVVNYTRPSTNPLEDLTSVVPNTAESFYNHHVQSHDDVEGCSTSSTPTPTSTGSTLTAPDLIVEVFSQKSLSVRVHEVTSVDEGYIDNEGNPVAGTGGYLVQWHGPGGRFRTPDTVECGSKVTGTCESSERQFDITGLAHDTEYTVRARAFNPGVVSPWSTTSARTLGPLRPPLVTQVSATESSITLSLEHDGDVDEFAASEYEVEWRVVGSDEALDTTTVAAPAPPQAVEVVLSELAANATYLVRIRAVSASGQTTAWSGGKNYSTAQSQTVGSVTSLAVRPDYTSAQLTFVGIDGGASYRIGLKLQSATNYPALADTPLTQDQFFEFTGLSIDTDYDVRVRAERDGALGAWNSMSFTTLEAPLTAPTYAIPEITDHSFRLTIAASVDTAIGGDSYEARAVVRGGEHSGTTYGARFAELTDSSWEATVSGLAQNTSYSVTTRSCLDGRCGDWGQTAKHATLRRTSGCTPEFKASVDASTMRITGHSGVLDSQGRDGGRYWVTSKNVSITFDPVDVADKYFVFVVRTIPLRNCHDCMHTATSTSPSFNLDTIAGTVPADTEGADASPAEYHISVRPVCEAEPYGEFEGEESQSMVAVYSSTRPEPLASSIGYMPPNTAPVASADSAVASEDTPLIIDVRANDEDADGDELEVIEVSQPDHGSTRMTDGAVEYQPAHNFNGADQFTYKVSDGRDTAEAEVDVVVEAVNDLPEPVGTIPDQIVEVTSPVTVGLAEYFRDPDGDELRYTVAVAGSAVATVAGDQLLIEATDLSTSTVTVTAADPDGLTGEQLFAVQGTDNRAREVVEDTLAAIGRGYLASARTTLSRRVESNGQEQSRLTVAGVSVPMNGTEAASSAQQWLSAMAGPSMRTESAGMMTQQSADTGPREDGIRSPFMGSGPTEFMVGFGGTGEEEGSGRRWTAWGQSDMQMFEGGRNSATYGGSLLSINVGVDAKLSERWLAGLAVSRSRAEADWSFGEADGVLTTTMTSLQPYIRWADDRTSVWAMAGGGSGDIGNDRLQYGLQEQNGLGLRFGLAEARRQLGTVGGGMHLALRGDASWAHLSTGEGLQLIDSIGVGVHQLRMGLDVSRSFIAGGAAFEPFGEVHARRDGGSGQTGTGMELAGGLRVSRGIFRVEGMGRVLTMHTAENYRERGAALKLSVGEGAQQPGLTVSLQPRWGAPASGSQMLWQDQLYESMQNGDAKSLDARVDYGFQAWGGLVSPFSLYGSSQYGQRMQLGLSVGVGRLQLESSVERNADPLRGGSATRVSIMGSLSLSGRSRPGTRSRATNTRESASQTDLLGPSGLPSRTSALSRRRGAATR